MASDIATEMGAPTGLLEIETTLSPTAERAHIADTSDKSTFDDDYHLLIRTFADPELLRETASVYGFGVTHIETEQAEAEGELYRIALND